MNSNFVLVNFAFLPWSDLWKRNQSLIYNFSEKFKVKTLFINPYIWLSYCLSGYPLNNLKIKIPFFSLFYPYKKTNNLFVLTPFHFSLLRSSFYKKIFLYLLNNFVAEKKIILFLNTLDLSFLDIISEIKKYSSLTIFDFSDNFLDDGYEKELSILSQISDIFLVTNKFMHLRIKEWCYEKGIEKKIYIIENAINHFFFSPPRKVDSKFKPLLKSLANLNNPIGYIGSFTSKRIDTSIVYSILDRGYNVVVIGPAEKKILSVFESYPNFFYYPYVPSFYLPYCIDCFRVCIVPFLRNSHTLGNSLLKYYEYLSRGKPVVSTDVAQSAKLKDYIYIVRPDEFVSFIEKGLKENDNLVKTKRIKFAWHQAWTHRVELLFKIILKNLEC